MRVHERGAQSETSIAIDPHNSGNVIAGTNEIQRLPMRANVSTDGGASFTGVDLKLPPPRTQSGFGFGSDPGIAFDPAGTAYYSYIVVFSHAAEVSTAPRWRSRARPTTARPGLRRSSTCRPGTPSSTTSR